MYMKHSKSLLFILLSMVSTHQATADVRSVAIKGGHTVMTAGTLLLGVGGFGWAYTGYKMQHNSFTLIKSEGQTRIAMGLYAALFSLYSAGSLIKNTYFETPPVCSTCTPQQSEQKESRG